MSDKQIATLQSRNERYVTKNTIAITGSMTMVMIMTITMINIIDEEKEDFLVGYSTSTS